MLFSTTYSQVNVSISNMQYINGTPISNCGTIDFDTNPTVRVQFTINLSKQTNQVVGTSNLYVYTIGSSGSRIERKNEIVQSVSFDTNYQSSADITMNASDFNTSGGTLFAVFKSSGNIEYQTICSYPIIKTQTPTFTLSPSTLSIPCGSVAPVTFTYSNVYNTPNVTYNYGYSGWTFVSQTANSITLKPTNGNILPSNFSLIPLVNGVFQPSKTCVVSRAEFTTNSVIQGNGVVCPGSTQTFNLTNSSTFSSVSWNIPEFAVASITGSSNSTVTVQVLSSGTFTINANITNSCGQTATIPRTFNIGVPSVNPNTNTILGINDWYSTNYISPVVASVYNVQNASSYVWTITGSTISSNCTNTPKFSNGGTTMTTYSNQVNINWGGCAGNFVLWCKPKNDCGISHAILAKGVTVGSALNNPCDNNPIGLKMINPVKENGDIVLNIHHSQIPCDVTSNYKIAKPLTKEEINNIKYSIEIYDFFGRKILSKQYNTNEVKIQDANLTKGKYIINISNDLGYNKREILIVE